MTWTWIVTFEDGSSMHSGSAFISMDTALGAAIRYSIDPAVMFKRAIVRDIDVFEAR
jgi:hypothetical protein